MNALAAALERRERSTASERSRSRAAHSRRTRTSRSAALAEGAQARRAQQHQPVHEISTEYDAAFVQAYQTYYTRIFAFVYGRLGSVEATKDLTADIFERAYTKGHGLRQPQSYASWLFKVATSMVAGHYRQRRRESDGMDSVRSSLTVDDRSQDVESCIIKSERVNQLMRHVRALSPRDQELLSLRFDAELTGEEIAQVMDMTSLNVRVAIHRALRRLRARLKDEAISVW